ncbi:hypothetical protein M758_7G186900 [Ceratodon purpureus]|uniref:Uncharacterized protein n=1 Tax=Ceratodon purpureus TaxID=3225 RepID=A0A8T0HDC5_CERPU|nr:hypothetical protein KC19_7G190200 [Ceratodon purpureus]KAG0612055.1 hypothetical protein M758_7G186900 [Ceratodon purpureus]
MMNWSLLAAAEICCSSGVPFPVQYLRNRSYNDLSGKEFGGGYYIAKREVIGAGCSTHIANIV